MSSTLHIAFQDGFDEDNVTVRVDGEEVFRREGVSTDPRISLATGFDLPREPGPLTLEVELGRRGISESLQLELHDSMHVAVSVVESGLRFRQSARPFGYV